MNDTEPLHRVPEAATRDEWLGTYGGCDYYHAREKWDGDSILLLSLGHTSIATSMDLFDLEAVEWEREPTELDDENAEDIEVK